MKYIRTKDKIIGERIYENDIPEPKNEHEKEILQKLRDNIGEIIIKQANTIEELCDEFVLENEITTVSKCTLMKQNIFEKLRKVMCEAFKETHKNCYGAIWTDKGLIYVAKMNNKGELELL